MRGELRRRHRGAEDAGVGEASQAGVPAQPPAQPLPEDTQRNRLTIDEAMRLGKVALLMACLSFSIAHAVWRAGEPSFELRVTATATYADAHSGAPVPDERVLDDDCGGGRCFDYSRPGCAREPLPVFIYPGAPLVSADQAAAGSPYERLLWLLQSQQSQRLVANASEACLFVPPFSTWDGVDVSALRALPHWDAGRNHIVLDGSPHGCLTFETDFAVRLRARADERCYFFHHDVVLASLPPGTPLSAAEAAAAPANALDSFDATRQVLVSFSGLRYTDLAPPLSRQHLVELHDPPYVVIAARCAQPELAHAAFRCAALDARADQTPHEALLRASQYTMLPAGPEDYLAPLVEVLARGALPVIMAAGALHLPVLPLAEVAEWERLVFFLDTSSASVLAERLYNYPAEGRAERAAAARVLLRDLFSSHEAMLAGALDIIERRVAAARRGISAVAAGLDIAYLYVLREGVAAEHG